MNQLGARRTSETCKARLRWSQYHPHTFRAFLPKHTRCSKCERLCRLLIQLKTRRTNKWGGRRKRESRLRYYGLLRLSYLNPSKLETTLRAQALEPKMRIELTTYALRVRCSTPELPGRVIWQIENSISLNIPFGQIVLFREDWDLDRECIMVSGSTDHYHHLAR